MSDNGKSRPVRFGGHLQVRCPETLPAAVEKAAAIQCTSPAEYVRRSLVDRLRADGIDPSNAGVA